MFGSPSHPLHQSFTFEGPWFAKGRYLLPLTKPRLNEAYQVGVPSIALQPKHDLDLASKDVGGS